MILDDETHQIVSASQIIARMAQHIADGHKLITQQEEPKQIGDVYTMFNHPFRVLRESTAYEYEHEGNGPAHRGCRCYYYEVEVAD